MPVSVYRKDGLPKKAHLVKLLRAGIVNPGRQGSKFVSKSGALYYVTSTATLKRIN